MKTLPKFSFGASLAVSAFTLLLLSAPSMHADTLYNLSFAGSVNGTGTMDLNSTTGQITITLTNTTNLDGSSPSGDDNLIAGLIFTLSSAPASNSVSLASQSGALVDVPTGTHQTATPVTGSPDHWGSSNKSSNAAIICLETAGSGSPDCATGGKPNDLIITDEAEYHINSSVVQHQPSILGTGTFVIDVPNLAAGTTVLSDSVSAVYGTSGSKEDVTLTPVAPVPEPASLFLVGSGLLGAAGVLRRKIRTKLGR